MRGVPFIAHIGNLKTNRREMAHGRSEVVRAVWYGELLMTRGRMLRMRYAERRTTKQHLAATPTVWSIVRRSSLTAKKNRKTEMWRETGTLSAILHIWNLVRPWKRYARTRPRFWGGALSWEFCRYTLAHCWISVDMSAHVIPRKRLVNMRMLMQMAIPEGVKACVPVEGTAEEVTEVLLFDWDWATN
jgi:hypothetical protein